MKPGLDILDKMSIPFVVRVTSAHRTPGEMADFSSSAASKGIKVIIAAAGGAAHLPGMAAAHTSLVVIGVPVKGSTTDGMDSLFSIVQMPRGVPVATVGIGNSTNAALLAARTLGLFDERIRKEVVKYAAAAAETSLTNDKRPSGARLQSLPRADAQKVSFSNHNSASGTFYSSYLHRGPGPGQQSRWHDQPVQCLTYATWSTAAIIGIGNSMNAALMATRTLDLFGLKNSQRHGEIRRGHSRNITHQ